MFDLNDKVALVTGAARGLGQAIAVKLAEAGADVALCDLNAEWLEETAGKVKAIGRRAECYGVNVAEGDSVAEGVKAIAKDFGKIDVLVNNAGITKDGLLMRMSEDDWDAVLNVNLKGTFLCHDEAAFRNHCQHCFGHRADGQCRAGQLCGLQGRRDFLQQDRRKGAGVAQRSLQRGRPGLHPYGYDRRAG